MIVLMRSLCKWRASVPRDELAVRQYKRGTEAIANSFPAVAYEMVTKAAKKPSKPRVGTKKAGRAKKPKRIGKKMTKAKKPTVKKTTKAK